MSHFDGSGVRESSMSGLQCRSAIAFAVGLAVLAVAGCSDRGTTRPVDDLPDSGDASTSPFIAAKSLPSARTGEVVYISLQSGVIPDGKRATLRVLPAGMSIHTVMVDGGFDPVAVSASVGDTVTIQVEMSDGSIGDAYTIVVPKQARPVIVRTVPPKHKRDVALNAAMMVVFSEPIDSSALISGSVSVRRDGIAVAGTLRFADASQVSLVFVPLEPLAGGTEYELVVTSDIRDLQGSSLESGATVSFGTVTGVEEVTGSLTFLVQPRMTSRWAFITPHVQVGVLDSAGRLMDGSSAYVTMTLESNPSGGTLSGTYGNAAVNGIAHFPNQSIDKPGSNYVLVASSPGLTSARSAPFDIMELQSLLGGLRVTTTTTGLDLAPTSYTLRVDGRASVAIGLNASLIVADDLSGGQHVITLGGLSDKCMTSAPNPRSVEILAFDTADVSIAVTCAAAGSIRVATSTTGTDVDPDGYRIEIARNTSSATILVPANGTVTRSTPTSGPLVLSLQGVAENCRVAGGYTREIDLAADVVGEVAFEVACEPVTQLAFVRNDQIFLVNSNGTGLVQLTNTSTGTANSNPSWSPDGRRIVFTRTAGQSSRIYVMNADGSNVVGRSPAGAYDLDATWSPDGARILFSRVENGSLGVFTMSADADGDSAVRVVNRPGWDGQPAWSPDGSTVAFISDWNAYDFVFDLYFANADGSNIRPVLEGPFFWDDELQFYFYPAWSPDGSKIAITVCTWAWDACFPNSAVAVINADGSGRIKLASGGGDMSPTWSPDGKTLAYYTRSCVSCEASVRYVRLDDRHHDEILQNAYSPSWRPR